MSQNFTTCPFCKVQVLRVRKHLSKCPELKKLEAQRKQKPKPKKLPPMKRNGALQTEYNAALMNDDNIVIPRLRYNPVSQTMDTIHVVSGGRFESNRRK